MKQLKTSLRSFRDLFERSIPVITITEPLASFDEDADVQEVRAFARQKNYDRIGVRAKGLVDGYALAAELEEGILLDHRKSFSNEDEIEASAAIQNALKRLVTPDRKSLFVSAQGRVWGIVTRGDLQKAPVRMWLFGLLTLAEMNALRIIRTCCPDGAWKNMLEPKRIEVAQHTMNHKRFCNEESVDLADYLHIHDIFTVIGKGEKTRAFFKVAEGGTCGLFVRDVTKREETNEVTKLRNNIAHGSDLVRGNLSWETIMEIAQKAEDFVERAETFR